MSNVCKSFRRNKDGSWTCIKGITFSVPGGEVEALTGMKYPAGSLYAGLDVVSFLEKNCKAAKR